MNGNEVHLSVQAFTFCNIPNVGLQAVPWFRNWVSPCGIYGGQSGTYLEKN
jgi:hypothetical protein